MIPGPVKDQDFPRFRSKRYQFRNNLYISHFF